MHIRNRLRRDALCLCVVVLAAAPAHAQILPVEILPSEDHVIELGVMLWRPSPGLVLSTDALSDPGVNDVDVVQAFSVDGKWLPEFRAVIGRTHKLRLSHVSGNYGADATPGRAFTLEGQTFTAGDPASTEVDWRLWKVGYEWDFFSRLRGFAGFVADVKFSTIDTSIESLTAGSVAREETSTVPTLGMIGRVNISRMVAVTGEFTGMRFNRDDTETTIVDFDLYATVSVGRHVGVEGGYRAVAEDYLVEEDGTDLKMHGPYLGAVVRF